MSKNIYNNIISGQTGAIGPTGPAGPTGATGATGPVYNGVIQHTYELGSTTVNATPNSFYSINNVIINMYATYNIGERIIVKSNGPSQSQISFPIGSIFNNQAGPLIVNSPFGFISLITSGQLRWEIEYMSGSNWFIGANPLIPWNNKLSSLYETTIASPLSNQFLKYVSGSWQNKYDSNYIFFNSDGNIANNVFLYLNDYGTNASDTRTCIIIPENIRIVEFHAQVSIAPGVGTTRFLYTRINNSTDAITSVQLVINDLNTSATVNSSLIYNKNNRLNIFHTVTGGPANSQLYGYLKYEIM